jgi:hypothetical protein
VYRTDIVLMFLVVPPSAALAAYQVLMMRSVSAAWRDDGSCEDVRT